MRRAASRCIRPCRPRCRPTSTSADRPPLVRRRSPTLLKVALAVAGVLAALFIVELGARIVTGNWTGSFLERSVPLVPTGYPMSYDPLLGWIPRPGYSSDKNDWHRQVTINAEGLRTNGADSPAGQRPILAVGDSFTFGDQVADGESWPAQLERILGRPVLNGGVSGYGLDQAVLRARKLAAIVRPEWVIVSLIPEDITRCELLIFGAAKPYFTLEGGELRPGNQPVPPPQPVGQDTFRRIFGRSFVVHTVMSRFARTYWVGGRVNYASAHRDGEAVATRLLRSLADDLAESGVRLLVVVQGTQDLDPGQRALGARLLASLKGSPALTLDLHGALQDLRERDPERFKRLYRRHMTGDGNAFVAGQIAEVLRWAGISS